MDFSAVLDQGVALLQQRQRVTYGALKLQFQLEDEHLQVLQEELLDGQQVAVEVEYLFKHALTQEVAYGTVLQERRKALHEQTAQAIEELYGQHLDEHYSDLAIITVAVGMPQKPWRISAWRGSRRCGSQRTGKRSTISLRLLHCPRPYRTPLPAPAKNLTFT
jgi:hypothetical protein